MFLQYFLFKSLYIVSLSIQRPYSEYWRIGLKINSKTVIHTKHENVNVWLYKYFSIAYIKFSR